MMMSQSTGRESELLTMMMSQSTGRESESLTMMMSRWERVRVADDDDEPMH